MKENEQLRRLNHLFGETNAVYHEAALCLGLSDSAMAVLYTLSVEGGSCRISEIINQSGMSKQTLNSALRKLEEEAVICLEPDGGRSKRVVLTEKGHAHCERTVAQLIAAENRVFDSWTKEEREGYVAMTQRYLAGFRKEIKALK